MWYKRINTNILFILFLVSFLSGKCVDAFGQTAGADTVRVIKLIKDFNDTVNINPQRAFAIGEKVVELSKNSGYKAGVARGMLALGKLYDMTGNQAKSVEYLKSALQITREYHLKNIECKVLSGLGALSEEKSEYNTAFSYFTQALNAYQSLNDSSGVAIAYMNIGVCFMGQDNFEDALKNYNKAIDLFQSLNNPHQQASLYYNVGQLYFRHEMYDKGLGYIYAAIDLFTHIHESRALSGCYNTLANYHLAKSRIDSTLYYYNKALEIATHTGNKMEQAVALFNMGQVYEGKKDYSNTERKYRAALSIANEISYEKLMMETQHRLALLYGQMHNYKLAFAYYDSAYAIRDSFQNEEKDKDMAEMTARYNNNELEHKNELLQKENDIEHIKVQRKNIFVYSGFGAAILFLIIGFQVVRQNKLKANQQKMELEQKQLLAQINPHFIFNCLNSIQQFVVQNDTMNANKYLADFALLMRQTLDNSKDGTISLRREIEYLENYLSFEHMRFEDKFTYNIKCDPDVNIDSAEIPSMIIQPFVENAIRHGLCNLETRKGLLNISFYRKDGFLFCEVDDNGIGMEEAQKLKEQTFIKYQSHGMELTQQRLALVSKMYSEDYKINIVNKQGPDQSPLGTTIIIKFPMQV